MPDILDKLFIEETKDMQLETDITKKIIIILESHHRRIAYLEKEVENLKKSLKNMEGKE